MKTRAKNTHAGRGGNNISLHPLTPDQALKALLSISPKDAKEIRDQEAGMKRDWRKPKAKGKA
jgi:hypothetical protein